ncbi:MAG: isoprenyl transferase [Verrucomicrobia bacterium]|jgi:undecaprenyl diphosphate synthase|nr:isoprenyl transferase [Verrucomicrobiota bacterium]MBT4275477.1 isoprenyl transferase [Verrucomicrobiota bacterium]MBT5061527.1 isoprenyl transferase [Verrucomicrobiota bacterium]MBT5477911.1 isoprenyl transferase [Verrucomicrobiota bacterium]MBT6238274.1 isoprenyl transferase [Verrucomicrobiota bacterium]
MPDDLLSNLSPEAQQVLPKHVAIIMDGNGRWAKQRRLPRTVGHRRGLESLRTVVRTASRLGIKYLTLFTFSAENWNRPKSEVDTIMRYLGRFLRTEIPEFNSYNVQLDAIGQIERLPQKVQDQLAKTKETLSNNDGMTMVLALSYGARQEMIDATRAIADKVQKGELTSGQINEEMISNHLYTSEIPDPELLVRTSGEMRISNFLLWQISYAELVITDTLWPDFRAPQLYDALEAYAKRHRRFGKV